MLALFIAIVAIPAASAEAAAWLPPTDISDEFSDNDFQELATDATGAAQIVWLREEGASDRLLTRRVGADGTLGPVMSLDTGSLGTPHISMDPAGRSIIVWTDGSTVNFIRLDAGGDPIEPVTPLSTVGSGPSVVMDQDGNATVVWPETASGPASVLRFSRIPAGGAPTAPATLFTAAFFPSIFVGSPLVALDADPSGVVTAGWIDLEVQGAFPSHVRVKHINPNGTLGPERNLDNFNLATTRIQLGVDSNGDAVALWRNDSTLAWRAQQFSATDALGTLHDISNPAATSTGSGTISVQPDGSALIGWAEAVGGGDATNVQRLLANDTLDPTQVLSDEFVSDLTSALTAAAGTVFAWILNDGSFDRVESRRLDSSDNLSPTDTGISDGSSDAMATMAAGTPGGQPSILWNWDHPGGGMIVQLSYFDATPPLITTLSGPSSAGTGQQLTFAASATDRSGIASFDWTFGDGGGASGPIVQHSYAGPGSFTVTLTVTDNAGNESVSQHLVTVSAPPAADGGALSPFTVGGLDGRDLLVNVPSAGVVNVSNAGAQGASTAAVTARKKKRGRKKLRPSSATGGPGVIRVRLRLTRAAKRKLKRKRKLGVGAVIAFTPNGGATTTQVTRLRLRR